MNTLLPARQHGQIMVIMALLLISLLGMVGIAIDLGFGYQHRREVQNAADAAAMAGALALGRHVQYDRLSSAERLQLGLTSDAWGTGNIITQEATNAAVMAMPPFPTPNSATGRLATDFSWPPSGSTGSLNVQYVLVDGSVAAVGSGTPPATAAGVRVTANASYATLFARVIGFANLPVEGTSRAMLRPLAGAPTGAPFIVCGGTSGGAGAWLSPDRNPNPPDPFGVSPGDPTYQNGGYWNGTDTVAVSMWVSGSSPRALDYNTWVGRNFMVHWSQIGQSQRVGSDCGAGGQMNGLADPNSTCSPTGSTPLPCTEPWRSGTVAGTTTQLVAGLPGCSGTSWNNCVMLLPVADGCNTSGTCNILTYAPFLIMDGTLPINGAYAPQSGCNSNCHIGQLLPAAMSNGQAGTGVFNPQTSTGLFTVQLSCDPMGVSGCGL